MEVARNTLSGVSIPDLLGRYAAILYELRARGVVRTRNAPLGDYAEYLAARVYSGVLAANSVKSYDLLSADGRRVQVKARTVGSDTHPGAVFSAFRSFDFDVAVLVTFDSSTYALQWARGRGRRRRSGRPVLLTRQRPSGQDHRRCQTRRRCHDSI